MTRAEFSKPYLVALYTMNRIHPNIAANIGEIISKFHVPRDDYFEGELVEFLLSQGWVLTPARTTDPTAPMVITGNGKMHAENLIEQGVEAVVISAMLTNSLSDPETDFTVPASDRIVSLSDNVQAVTEIRQSLGALAKHLSDANDVGGFSEDEVQAARREVWHLQEAFDEERLRVDWVEPLATKTLKWVAEKAAGAAVGKAAWAVLLLIAALFGFSI